MFFTYFHSKSQMPHNMKVVPPRQNTQLLHWEILKCLGEIWRTRQKFWAT
jgi:hypothetical protein